MKTTASGKTVEEAVNKALAELNVSEDKVEVVILESPQKGFLGLIGTKPAVVEVTVKIDPITEGATFLQKLFQLMNVETTISQTERSGDFLFELTGEDVGVLIGKRGQTLDSLQLLVNLVVNRYGEKYVKVELDAENYREHRKKALVQLAERLAAKVKRTKGPIRLEPMQAYERKIIHAALQSVDGIKTYSEGHEPRRYLVIAPGK